MVGVKSPPTAAEDSFREAASVPPALIHRAVLIHPQKNKNTDAHKPPFSAKRLARYGWFEGRRLQK
jgi:hypothetical protein